MFQKIPLEHAAEAGIAMSLKRDSDSGETRVRVSGFAADVTLTQLPAGQGSWQKSHRHVNVTEHSFVIQGWVALVTQSETGALFFKRYAAGDCFNTRPGLIHNLYLAGDTVLSTVKVGDNPEERDWIPCPELDDRLSALSESKVLEHIR